MHGDGWMLLLGTGPFSAEGSGDSTSVQFTVGSYTLKNVWNVFQSLRTFDVQVQLKGKG